MRSGRSTGIRAACKCRGSRRTVFRDLERTGAGDDGLAREPAEHAGQGEEAEQRGHSECGQGADHARRGGGVPVFTPPPPTAPTSDREALVLPLRTTDGPPGGWLSAAPLDAAICQWRSTCGRWRGPGCWCGRPLGPGAVPARAALRGGSWPPVAGAPRSAAPLDAPICHMSRRSRCGRWRGPGCWCGRPIGPGAVSARAALRRRLPRRASRWCARVPLAEPGSTTREGLNNSS